ncbi:MAG: AraC family transcriptional regulator [Paenibacillaceae bacterium]|nr:AraC family transcriptional regulator [Paenibacillaceae bacterium]
MPVFPEYQDVVTEFEMKNGELPFYMFSYMLKSSGLHYHDFAEFSFILGGGGSLTASGRTYRLEPGTMTFLLPQHLHESQCDDGNPLHKYGGLFDLHLLGDLSCDRELTALLLTVGTELPCCVQLETVHAERMRGICAELLAESKAAGAVGQRSMIRAKLTEALLLFLRQAAATNEAAARSGSGGKSDDPTFWTILSYIHVHYQQTIGLQQLARQFRVSVPFISRGFRQHKGTSYLGYVHELRMKHAASLLISTNMAIADIAVEVGFDSFRSFSRVFRDTFGRTPSEFRTQGEAAAQAGARPGQPAVRQESGRR